MVGLILAALYAAYAIVANEVTPVAAVEATLPFLFYWHCFWGAILVLVGLLVPLGGTLLSIGGSTGGERAAGLAMLLGSPLIILLLILGPALFIGGVYCVDSGIEGGEIVNQNHVIVGGVLYGIAILCRLCSKFSTSSD